MACKASVRAEIERDECVAQQEAVFVCFWHQKSEALQWLDSGDAGLAQLEQQRKVFADQGLEVHGSIWGTTELGGAPYVVEFQSFGPTGDSAAETPDIVALALASKTIMRRYVYAVCRHLGKVSADEKVRLLRKASGETVPDAPRQDELSCVRCGRRKLPSAQVLEPGAGYPDTATVKIHNATVLLFALNGGVTAAEFQSLPDVPDATGVYDADEKGATRKFGSGGGAGARLRVQDLLKLSRCSRCRSVQYCSAACQKADWRGHKIHCAAAS